VWLLALVYFLCVMGLYGVSFWLPQLIKNSGVTDVFDIGLLSAVPYGVAAVTMVLAARHSDRSGERRWHTALAALAGALGLVAATLYSDNTVIALAALSVATAGILSTFPIFWSLPTAMLGGAAAAAGIAMINSVGNLAGFVAPYLVGAIRDDRQHRQRHLPDRRQLGGRRSAGGGAVRSLARRRQRVEDFAHAVAVQAARGVVPR
jgi:cyanate permease